METPTNSSSPPVIDCDCDFCAGTKAKAVHEAEAGAKSKKQDDRVKTALLAFAPRAVRGPYPASISSATAAVEFYTLQLLSRELVGKRSRRAVLAKTQRRLDKLTRSLALAMRDYLIACVWGELRHSHTACEKTHPVLPSGRNRAGALRVLLDEGYSPDSVIALARVLFGCAWGGSSIGGPKWLQIAEVAGKYGKWPDALFVDMVFGLSHNCGTVFNKTEYGIFSPSRTHCHLTMSNIVSLCDRSCRNSGRYKCLLDARHEAASVGVWLQSVISLHMQAHLCDDTLKLLAEAGYNDLAQSIMSHPLRAVHHDDARLEQGCFLCINGEHGRLYEYSPIEWGTAEIDIEAVVYREERGEDCTYYCGCGEEMCSGCGNCHACMNLCDDCCSCDWCKGCGGCIVCDDCECEEEEEEEGCEEDVEQEEEEGEEESTAEPAQQQGVYP